MKKFILLSLLFSVSFLATAQKKNLELTAYGGWNTYSKQGSKAYEHSYKGTFGVGFQAKYYIKDHIFWATDLYGGVNDDTEHTLQVPAKVLLSQYRKDFSLATGVGVNLYTTDRINGYLQLQGGVGTATGTWSMYISESEGVKTYPLNHTSFIISPAVGIDFKLADHWKLGLGYAYRYLHDLDGNHSLALRATYVID